MPDGHPPFPFFVLVTEERILEKNKVFHESFEDLNNGEPSEDQPLAYRPGTDVSTLHDPAAGSLVEWEIINRNVQLASFRN
jgi:hypothetical protein